MSPIVRVLLKEKAVDMSGKLRANDQRDESISKKPQIGPILLFISREKNSMSPISLGSATVPVSAA